MEQITKAKLLEQLPCTSKLSCVSSLWTKGSAISETDASSLTVKKICAVPRSTSRWVVTHKWCLHLWCTMCLTRWGIRWCTTRYNNKWWWLLPMLTMTLHLMRISTIRSTATCKETFSNHLFETNTEIRLNLALNESVNHHNLLLFNIGVGFSLTNSPLFISLLLAFGFYPIVPLSE